MMSRDNFAPKGGMCVNCIHSRRRCDDLPFYKMKVVDICKVSLIKIVACAEYTKKTIKPSNYQDSNRESQQEWLGE